MVAAVPGQRAGGSWSVSPWPGEAGGHLDVSAPGRAGHAAGRKQRRGGDADPFPVGGCGSGCRTQAGRLLVGFVLWIAYGAAAGMIALVIPNAVALLTGRPW